VGLVRFGCVGRLAYIKRERTRRNSVAEGIAHTLGKWGGEECIPERFFVAV